MENKLKLMRGLKPGTHLYYNKSSLSMKASQSEIETDFVILLNAGSTTLYLKWEKVERELFIKTKSRDNIVRFFTPFDNFILKPGDSKTI